MIFGLASCPITEAINFFDLTQFFLNELMNNSVLKCMGNSLTLCCNRSLIQAKLLCINSPLLFSNRQQMGEG